jgi:exonuclease SbcD
MTKDQSHILKQLMLLIEQEKPDVLIIAGDLYDRSVPPIEAVELLDQTLTDIIMKYQIKVMVIAGNHDCPDRVGFASQLLKDNGLHISGNLRETIEPITLQDDDGPVHFYLIPYAEPAIAREIYHDETISHHDSAMKVITTKIKKAMNHKERNICVAHAFLMGTDTIETSESERPLSMGGSEYVDVNHFEAFNYTALGHLHKPQRVKHEKIRYSGSLLRYSFSEATQVKSVAMIELDGVGEVSIVLHQLEPVRDMRVIKGSLENLIDVATYGSVNTDDYLMAILTDEGELIDPIGTLRAVYPNVLRVEKESYDRIAGEDQTSASENFKQKNPLELFKEFYENISGDEFDDDKSQIVGKVVETIEQKARIS